jgi:hypothetical protein
LGAHAGALLALAEAGARIVVERNGTTVALLLRIPVGMGASIEAPPQKEN